MYKDGVTIVLPLMRVSQKACNAWRYQIPHSAAHVVQAAVLQGRRVPAEDDQPRGAAAGAIRPCGSPVAAAGDDRAQAGRLRLQEPPGAAQDLLGRPPALLQGDAHGRQGARRRPGGPQRAPRRLQRHHRPAVDGRCEPRVGARQARCARLLPPVADVHLLGSAAAALRMQACDPDAKGKSVSLSCPRFWDAESLSADDIQSQYALCFADEAELMSCLYSYGKRAYTSHEPYTSHSLCT